MRALGPKTSEQLTDSDLCLSFTRIARLTASRCGSQEKRSDTRLGASHRERRRDDCIEGEDASQLREQGDAEGREEASGLSRWRF